MVRLQIIVKSIKYSDHKLCFHYIIRSLRTLYNRVVYDLIISRNLIKSYISHSSSSNRQSPPSLKPHSLSQEKMQFLRESRSSPRLTEDPIQKISPLKANGSKKSNEFERKARERFETILAPGKNIKKKMKRFENKLNNSGKQGKLENLLKECAGEKEGREMISGFERRQSLDLRKINEIGKLQRLETPRYDLAENGVIVEQRETPEPICQGNKILHLDEESPKVTLITILTSIFI